VAKKQVGAKRARGGAARKTTSARRTVSAPRTGTPADGIRRLRERVEAAAVPGRKGELSALTGALARLEDAYARLPGGRPAITTPARQAVAPLAFPAAERPAVKAPRAPAAPKPAARQQVSFVPSPPDVVDLMLALARVDADDVVYDLGCGDGRIVIAAAERRGARGVGIDRDPDRIAEATANAEKAGVGARVSFHLTDFYQADVHDATVVMLYLLPSVNLELRERLLSQLKPGARIVSHVFDMGDWAPARAAEVDGRQVMLWTVPRRKATKKSPAASRRRRVRQ
jgi:SAM-dependent methyltransferase